MTRSVEWPLHLVQTADEGVMISVTGVMVGGQPTTALENPCNISLQFGAD